MSHRVLLIAPPARASFPDALGSWLPLDLLEAGAAARRGRGEPLLYDAHTRRDDLDAVRLAVGYAQPEVIVLPALPDIAELAALVKAAAFDAKVVVIGDAEPADAIDTILPRPRDLATFFGATAATVQPELALADWSLYRHHAIPKSRLGIATTFEQIEPLHRRHKANVIRFAGNEETIERLSHLNLKAQFIVDAHAAEVIRCEKSLAKWRKAGVIHVRLDTPLAAAIEMLRSRGIVSEARVTQYIDVFPDLAEMCGSDELEVSEAWRSFYTAKVRELEGTSDAHGRYLHACVEAIMRSEFFTDRMKRLLPVSLAPRKNRGHLAFL